MTAETKMETKRQKGDRGDNEETMRRHEETKGRQKRQRRHYRRQTESVLF